MNFKKQLFFGAIALLTVGLTGCANNTSSNSSNNQATSSKSSKTNQSSSHELTITDIVGTYVNKDKTAAVVLQNGHTLWYYQTKNHNDGSKNDSGNWHYEGHNKFSITLTHRDDNNQEVNTNANLLLEGKKLTMTEKNGQNKQGFTKTSNEAKEYDEIFNPGKKVDSDDPSTSANKDDQSSNN
ncbi:hypothetical protein HMPREF3210_00144 [Lactobacillus gasseri]|uniref:hypothetical protein n=1 Tax=Lactobacillus gasseri TaxID=1596 RepID=UPI00076436AA|nr:hypothetical protein [Lactobacillus gasseri]KXA28069.1 hypothetical protein HMPREF3210_00144 [Lactobacillus gasseri]